MAYSAIVARVHTRPHPNADRLLIGTCAGHQVIVGKETRDGELGVFFPCDGQLSEQMVVANNLYSKAALDKLGVAYEPTQRFGFFSEKRRVRAQTFRGVKSDGFWVPLSYLAWAGWIGPEGGYIDVTEGREFTEINGHEVCAKYETPATKQARAQGLIGRRQRENRCFPKHDVTKKWQYVQGTIPQDAVIYITEKLHGTSGRYGHVLDEITLPWWKQIVNGVIGPIFPDRVYAYLNGSKNVILEKTTGAGYYGTHEFRYRAIENVTLHKGEILYFEIVGDVEAGKPIMAPQPIGDELKTLRAFYHTETMRYTYGCAPGQCDIYVYRIVRMNEDGIGVDLAWPEVKRRCGELGIKHVPEIVIGPRTGLDLPQIEKLVEQEMEGQSTLDDRHIREGVVVRVESPAGVEFIKAKSWTFGVLEGYIKDLDTYVDTEEAS